MSTRPVRVFLAPSQHQATEEACRRLAVMAQKWPEVAWRMSVKKVQPQPNWHRSCRWAVYALAPQMPGVKGLRKLVAR